MRIIYGTTNIEKKEQIKNFFEASNIDVEIMTLKDIGFDKEIIEDGETCEQNSMIKAKEIQQFCKERNIKDIIVTDDTGLCVECLNGKPGVHTARYGGDHPEQQFVIKKLLNDIEKTGSTNRNAKFICVLTAVLPNGEIKQVRGETLGKIAEKPGTMGKLTFGPIFMPEGSNRVINDMKTEELGSTHREKAFLELLKIIRNSI